MLTNGAKGFTLIDLLLSIAIISLLSSVILFSVSNSRALAQDAHMKIETDQTNKAIELYKSDNDFVPHDLTASTYNWYLEGDSDYEDVLGELVPEYMSEVPHSPTGDRYFYGVSDDFEDAIFGAVLNDEDVGNLCYQNGKAIPEQGDRCTTIVSGGGDVVVCGGAPSITDVSSETTGPGDSRDIKITATDPEGESVVFDLVGFNPSNNMECDISSTGLGSCTDYGGGWPVELLFSYGTDGCPLQNDSVFFNGPSDPCGADPSIVGVFNYQQSINAFSSNDISFQVNVSDPEGEPVEFGLNLFEMVPPSGVSCDINNSGLVTCTNYTGGNTLYIEFSFGTSGCATKNGLITVSGLGISNINVTEI